jgi:hypothetical protein
VRWAPRREQPAKQQGEQNRRQRQAKTRHNLETDRVPYRKRTPSAKLPWATSW